MVKMFTTVPSPSRVVLGKMPGGGTGKVNKLPFIFQSIKRAVE